VLEQQAARGVPKTVQTWDETGRLSAEIQKDYQKAARMLGKAKRGEALTAVEIDAARQINVNAVSNLKDLAETLPPEQFQAAFQRYSDDVFSTVSRASSEAGRALNIHKKEIAVNRIGAAFAKLQRGLRPRELQEFKALNLENPVEVKTFIDRLGDPKLADYFYEYWYNAILSGPATHVVNAASNTAWMAFQVPHRALTAGIDKLYSTFTGAARTRYLNEVVPMMAGYRTGAVRGAKAAGEMARTGRISDFETKWAQEIGHALGAFERSPNAALRKVGPYLTVPTKALRAMDVWSNSIAYDAHIRALARRASNVKGLKGDARKTFETNFLKNLPKAAHDEAVQYAKYNTFMDDPGKFSSWIIEGRSKIPGGRLIIPFVNTIGNLMKRGIEMTPGLGLTMAKGKNVPEVIAKQLEGSILALYTLHKLDAGEITGAAPEKAVEREAFYRQGKKPWAIRVGDTWYQYRRIEPFNTVVASTAIVYDKLKNAPDEETATEAFLDAANAFKNNLIDSSYLQGMSQIFNRYGRARGMVQRTTASFVPYSGFWRSINRAYEVATEGSAKVRDTDDWLGAFSQVIPGLSAKIPARLNVWGEEITLPGGVFRQWLPYRWAEETIDPVELELEALGLYPGLPGQTVTIRRKQTRLDDAVYRDYCISYGARAKARMEQVMSSASYQRIKDPQAKKRVLDRELTVIRTRELARAKRVQLSQTAAVEYLGPVRQGLDIEYLGPMQ
jgi:hypothetical protein